MQEWRPQRILARGTDLSHALSLAPSHPTSSSEPQFQQDLQKPPSTPDLSLLPLPSHASAPSERMGGESGVPPWIHHVYGLNHPLTPPGPPGPTSLWSPSGDPTYDEADWARRRPTRSQPQSVITYGDEVERAGEVRYERRTLPMVAPAHFHRDIWGQPLSPIDGEEVGHRREDGEAAFINTTAAQRAQRWDSLTPSPPISSSVPPAYSFNGSGHPTIGSNLERSSLFSYTQGLPSLNDGNAASRTAQSRRALSGEEDDGIGGGEVVTIRSAPFLSPLSSAVGLEDLQQSYDHLLSDGDEDDDGLASGVRGSHSGPIDVVPPSPAHFFLLSSPSIAWTRPVTIIHDKEMAEEESGKRGGRGGIAGVQGVHPHLNPPISDLSVAARPFYPST